MLKYEKKNAVRRNQNILRRKSDRLWNNLYSFNTIIKQQKKNQFLFPKKR